MDEIDRLKVEKDAKILAHYYVDGEIQDIADFSNLGEFLDMPVRHYSTGMFVRLAFATSTGCRTRTVQGRVG